MFKIDTHTHILPHKLPLFNKLFNESRFIELHHQSSCPHEAVMKKSDGSTFRHIQANCWDPKIRIEQCDEHGIDQQVLSTIPVMFSYWANGKTALEVSRYLNDHIAEVVNLYPNRFIGLGTVPLQDPELAAREVERCAIELGLRGIEIGTHVGSINLDDKIFIPFYEAMEKYDMGLFVHPWDMMGMDTMKKYWLPWLVGMPAETSRAICSMIFGGVFDRFPKLKVAFAHGGGSFPSTLGRIQHGHQCRPDLCAIDNPNSPEKYFKQIFSGYSCPQRITA